MEHHAYVIAGEGEAGVRVALAVIKKEFGMEARGNPDVIQLTYGLLTVLDARKIISLAQQGSLYGEHKVLVVSASRLYHEAQNALLKLFEEPPKGTTLFLIIPELGQLLPTLRSRVMVLALNEGLTKPSISETAKVFLHANREKRGALIKKLTSGTDEEERRALRDEALALLNGLEQIAYGAVKHLVFDKERADFLCDIAVLRGYLYDRSAPVKMILEHVALTIPKALAK